MNLQTKVNDRPLCLIDIEGSGLDVAKDRIVSLAIRRITTSSDESFDFRCNPGIQMSDEVIAVHGITNEIAAKYHPFTDCASEVFDLLAGSDLAGFNLLNYDIPILWEELNRCGIQWSLDGVRVIDAGNIFKKKEERTLSAAVQFYCERTHEGAHDAAADVDATADVINSQLARYADLRQMSLAELDAFSRFDDRIDLAGKIVKGKDGRPTYAIGKVRGVAVEDDPSFADWMLSKDFSANTKMVLRKVLKDIEDQWRRDRAEHRLEVQIDSRDRDAIPESDIPF